MARQAESEGSPGAPDADYGIPGWHERELEGLDFDSLLDCRKAGGRDSWGVNEFSLMQDKDGS